MDIASSIDQLYITVSTPARWSPRGRLVAVVVFTAIVVAGAFFLYHHDPTVVRGYPSCAFHAVTGLYCPGCGATRALYQLLHGHLLMALRDNVFFCLILPGMALYYLILTVQPAFFQRHLSRKTVALLTKVLLYALVLFAVLRNIPVTPFTWLAPPR